MNSALMNAAPDVPSPARVAQAKSNVIVLTIGWTGSSVLAGLLKAAGFWTGPTHRKNDYDTYENVELIRLNRELMAQLGAGEHYAAQFRQEWIDASAQLAQRIDCTPYATLVAESESHAPWVWKDPRLWLTIRFWHTLLPPGRVKYILLTRSPLQAWVSCTLRRQIQTYGFMKRYNAAIEGSLNDFLLNTGAPSLRLVYEDLQLKPERELERLSAFLDTPVTLEHLRATYNKPLRRRNHGVVDALTACMVYLKNHGERLR